LQTGLGLLFLKYSRDDERQADDLGLRYVLREDYDAREVPDVFGMLDRLGEAAGGGGVPGWLATHPAPEDRRQHLRAAVAALGRDFSGAAVRQDEYYRVIDDMVFGDDPREGYFRGDRFVHPELRFSFTFPEDYQKANQKTAVLGVSQDNDAAVEVSLSAAETPAAGLQEFMRRSGITAAGEGLDRIHGQPTASSAFAAQTEGGTVRGLVAFVEHRDRVFRLLGYSTEAAWGQRREDLRRSLASFDRVSDAKDLDVEPMRVRIVDIERPQTLEGFARAFDASVDLQTLALINQVETGSRLEPGRSYKVVTTG
jgi:predicted Zn-dependent protease